MRRVRGLFPSHIIIAGNVVTQEMVEELVLSGADIVKVKELLVVQERDEFMFAEREKISRNRGGK